MKNLCLAMVLVPVVALAEAPTPPSDNDSQSADAAQTAPTQAAGTTTTTTTDGQGAAPTTDQPAATVKKKKSALANAVQARTPEEQAKQSGFQFIVQLDHYLGAGTFVDSEKYSYLGAFLTVVPQYLFGIGSQRLVASVTARLAYEYTMPDVETGRRVGFSDTRIGLSAPAMFRDKALTGVAFTPSLGLTVPSSPESFNAGLITALSAGVTMSRSVGVIDLRANVGASRAFYTSAQNGVRASDARDANGNLLVVCRAGESVCGFSNMNPAWSVNFGGQIQWRATGSLLVYAGYTFIKSWRHAATTTLDEYTPKAVDANGNPVADVGLGQQDRTSAFFGASYQLNEHYSVDLGVSNSQTPLTATGQVRFPFLSFGAWADNATSLYFTLTAAY